MSNLREIKQSKLRNLLRGAVSNDDLKARLSTISSARHNVTERDIKAFTEFTLSNELEESVYGEAFPKSSTELFFVWRDIDPLPLEHELALQIGRLKKHEQRLGELISAVSILNNLILKQNISSAIFQAAKILDEFGFSASLASKIIYLHSKLEYLQPSKKFSEEHTLIRSILEKLFVKNKNTLLTLYTSSLVDLFDYKSGLFDTIESQKNTNKQIYEREQTSGGNKYNTHLIEKTRFPCLHETSIDATNIYLMSCCSVLDVFINLSCINLHANTYVATSIQTYFSGNKPKEYLEVLGASDTPIETYTEQIHEARNNAYDDADVESYKLASAIPENKDLYQFRSSLDKQLIFREKLRLNTDFSNQTYFDSDLNIKDLAQPASSHFKNIHNYQNDKAHETVRSFATLFCLNSGSNFHDLNPQLIRQLLGQTVAFSKTLTIDEVLTIQEQGDKINSPIVSFLALVMLNNRSPNDDREYDLRRTFQIVLMDKYESNILKFLDWLYLQTPGLCLAIVDLCDLAFLERLYRINTSYEKVLDQRLEIYKWAAKTLDSNKYSDLAEQLRIDAKVTEIRGELDDSRIYVDEMRYKQWLLDFVSADLRRYHRQLEIQGISSIETTVEFSAVSADSLGPSIHFFKAVTAAYEQFCHNRIFGIDSYLSRRIRHGTLVGHLQSPIMSLIKEFKKEQSHCVSKDHLQILDNIYKKYSAVVQTLRDNKLHFLSDHKIEGIFDSNALSTPYRTRLLRILESQFRRVLSNGASSSMLIDIFPDICWLLLETDLEQARDEIERSHKSEIRPLLRQIGAINKSDNKWESLQAAIDLKSGELFQEVLGWFHRPARSSVSVTIEEIAAVVGKEIRDHRLDSNLNCSFSGERNITASGYLYQTIYDIFYVLFDNAVLYSDNSTIGVNVAVYTDAEQGTTINISVASDLKSNVSEESVSREVDSILSDDLLEDAMTREGNSGLGKVVWLIQNYPTAGNYDLSITNRKFKFDFGLPLIVLKES